MHKPIIVLIVLPMNHVSNYIGTWVLWGVSQALEVQNHLEAGLKHPKLYGCGGSHYLEGPLHGVQDPKEEWIRAFMFKSLEAQKTFPPVLCGLVRRMLPPSPGGSLLSTDKSCRRRRQKLRPGDRGTSQQALTYIKRRISLDGNSV